MNTELVFLQITLSALLVFTLCAGKLQNDKDYCEMDRDRCDDEGVYKYMGVTNYDDYAIRDILDDDFELIEIRPKLAVKKTEKTLNKYPNRSVCIYFRQLSIL